MLYVADRRLMDVHINGPIAEGETPVQAVMRTAALFGAEVAAYTYKFYDEPRRGEHQMFPVIIGSVWIERK